MIYINFFLVTSQVFLDSPPLVARHIVTMRHYTLTRNKAGALENLNGARATKSHKASTPSGPQCTQKITKAIPLQWCPKLLLKPGFQHLFLPFLRCTRRELHKLLLRWLANHFLSCTALNNLDAATEFLIRLPAKL